MGKATDMGGPHANISRFPGRSVGSGDGGGGTGNLGERIASLEAHVQYLATKEDLERSSKNALKWVVGIMITSLLAAVAATAAVMGVILR